MNADPALIEDLVVANRILAAQGIVDGFGHVSARHDEFPDRYLLARSMAPALVTADDIMEFDLDGKPFEPRDRAVYLERFIHGEIYRARPDVKAVVHSHSPSVIPFGVTGIGLKPVYHMSGFLGAGVPVFEIRDAAGDGTDMLISSMKLGAALAKSLGAATVALMRGHGDVVVGTSVMQVVYRAIYTEMNAKLELEARSLGAITYLSAREGAAAAAINDRVMGRAWELWKRAALEGM
ncbi:MAG TPA: class II aldolase/adducin family protein [Alphaproteobacteria bacterium]|nr:class II aldolase/adducin family protein [Alphaproteobacteria bacterium]